MKEERPNIDKEKSIGDYFPSSADPPWKKRKALIATFGLPVAILGGTSLALGLNFFLGRANQRATIQEIAASENPSGIVEHISNSGDASDSAHSNGSQLEIESSSWSSDDIEEESILRGDLVPDQRPDQRAENDDTESEFKTGSNHGKSKTVHEGKVGSGNTLSSKLASHGLTGRQINEIVQSFDGLFNFRDSRPLHAYRLELREDNREVRYFRYKVSALEIYEARRRGDSLKGSRVKVDSSIRRVALGRKITDSLAQSITRAGLKNHVFRAFMNSVGKEINFRNQLKKGDSFRVIAEEQLLKGKFIGYKAILALEYHGKATGRKRAFSFCPQDQRCRFYDERGISFDRPVLRNPLNYRRISSPFNPRRFHPVLKRRVPHNGVDFAAPRGTPVWSTAAGTVKFAARKGASGNLVIIRHDGNMESIYAHLQRFARGLKKGQKVRQGQVVGYVGSTGRSTGPHLHFGIKKNGRFVDPMKVKTGSGRPIDKRYRAQYFKEMNKLRRDLNAIRIN